MIEVNKSVIKLQAFYRMIKVRNALKKRRDESKLTKGNIDVNKDLINEFVKALKIRSLAPEEFYRVIDQKQLGKVTVESFISKVLERGLLATR